MDLSEPDLATRLADARHSTAHRLLAQRLVASGGVAEIKALVDEVASMSPLARSNAIKILSEVAPSAPYLLLPHARTIAAAIDAGSGIVVWEGMAILAEIAAIHADAIEPLLPVVRKAMTGPSVIARDRGVRILILLAKDPARYAEIMRTLLDTIRSCPVNQLPTYAEHVAKVAVGLDRLALRTALEQRVPDLPPGPKLRRVNALMSKLATTPDRA